MGFFFAIVNEPLKKLTKLITTLYLMGPKLSNLKLAKPTKSKTSDQKEILFFKHIECDGAI